MGLLRLEDNTIRCERCQWRAPLTKATLDKRIYGLAQQHVRIVHNEMTPRGHTWLTSTTPVIGRRDKPAINTDDVVPIAKAAQTLSITPTEARRRATSRNLLRFDGQQYWVKATDVPLLAEPITRQPIVRDGVTWVSLVTLQQQLGYSNTFALLQRAEKYGLPVRKIAQALFIKASDVSTLLSGKPRRITARWTPDELALVRQHLAGELSIDALCAQLQRSAVAVRQFVARFRQKA